MHILNRFTLQTPESVELEFTLAGIGNRALALSIDYPLWLLIMAGFLFLWSFMSGQVIELVVELTGNADTVSLWLASIAFLIFFGIYVGYFVFFETLWQGQTPGKRIAKIRVICNDGRPVGLSQTVLRSLLRPIDDFPFLGLVGGVLIFFTPREKRLGDFVAGTLVVVEEQAAVPSQLTLSDRSRDFAGKLLETSDFSRLHPDDFAIVRDYLQRRSEMLPAARQTVSLNLAQEVRDRLHLEKLPESVSPNIFLEAVYLAYQEQSS